MHLHFASLAHRPSFFCLSVSLYVCMFPLILKFFTCVGDSVCECDSFFRCSLSLRMSPTMCFFYLLSHQIVGIFFVLPVNLMASCIKRHIFQLFRSLLILIYNALPENIVNITDQLQFWNNLSPFWRPEDLSCFSFGYFFMCAVTKLFICFEVLVFGFSY